MSTFKLGLQCELAPTRGGRRWKERGGHGQRCGRGRGREPHGSREATCWPAKWFSVLSHFRSRGDLWETQTPGLSPAPCPAHESDARPKVRPAQAREGGWRGGREGAHEGARKAKKGLNFNLDPRKPPPALEPWSEVAERRSRKSSREGPEWLRE